jgi:limonene-1,2-epoxide hydrolase
MPKTVSRPGRRTVMLTLGALPFAASGCASLEASLMTDNVAVIRQFISAWPRLNPAELASYFTDDGVYHNMPTGPVSGRANVERFIGGFIKPWTSTEWDILNIAAAGDVVMVERLDRTRVGERHIDLPCCGVFEMQGGKIKTWRDYFDLQSYMKVMTG